MRVTFVGKALIAFSLIGLVGCQGAAPSAEQAARREKIEQANLRNAQAFCTMIDEANRLTIAHRQMPPENDDCAYFRRNGTLVGYSPAVRNQYTGFFDNLRDVAAYGRAQKAALPVSVKNDPDASDIYRKLLIRGFDEEIAGEVSRSRAFLEAAIAFRHARQAQGIK
ncbi:hypothetical protein [Agrobacterium deltaense]|uniref:hypothetical protein n=1 Tax=Agrobacterium deltaense TaxID=1183412 RepID=UPI001C6DFC5B|nr:hypothetical protein [Agrobacterium deltaense]MBW9074672.1 hypothetical protein [Agrobacterium deltaense]